MLKSPFLHSVENWIKCDDTILLQQGATPIFFARGRGCRRHYQGVGGIRCWSSRVQNHFSDRTLFFDIHFKNTSNLNFLGFKVPNERFFHKDFKTGLIFWHMCFLEKKKLSSKLSPFGWDTLYNTTTTNVVEKDVNLRTKVNYFSVYHVKAGAFEQKWEFL